MTHLVNDRPPNLLDDLGIGVAHRADGTPVDRDPVRQGAGTSTDASMALPGRAPKAGRATVVLHSDRHVAHEFAQLCGYAVERLAHHHLETLGINFDHAASVQPDAIRGALRIRSSGSERTALSVARIPDRRLLDALADAGSARRMDVFVSRGIESWRARWPPVIHEEGG